MVGGVFAKKNWTLLGESQQLGLRCSKHTHEQHHDEGPKVTVEVRVYGRVTVADVEEDDTNQQTQKERKEKTGCQSDSVTMQVPDLADAQQLDLSHQARGILFP
jgi:hypothetical protein